MSDRTQDIKNLRAVATACKNYTDKKIEDLQWQLGTYDLGVETVNGTTMLLPTPANTIQATMVRIDGASEVSENLAIFEDETITSSDVSFTFLNGVCNSSGTPSGTGWIRFKTITLPAGSYGYADLGSGTTKLSLTDANYQVKSSTFTLNETTTLYWSVTGSAINTYGQLVNSKPMLVKGSTAPTTFKPYFSGIHNLELSGLKVEGFNKWDEQQEVGNIDNSTGQPSYNNSSRRTKNYTSVLSNTNYYFYWKTFISNSALALYQYDSNNALTGEPTYFYSQTRSFTTAGNCKYIKFRIYNENWNENSNPTLDICINISGSANGTYVPYVAPTTLPIDLTSIEDSGGNKLFADGKMMGNSSVTDFITPTNQESAWNKVNLGSLTFTYTSSQEFQAPIINMKNIADNVLGNLVCSIYKTIKWNELGSNDMAIASAVGYIRIKNSNYTDATAFKTAMNGVILNYERATPLTSNTDLSQLVKFEAHSNGSITLVNTNNQDTTSTFKYLKEVAK